MMTGFSIYFFNYLISGDNKRRVMMNTDVNLNIIMIRPAHTGISLKLLSLRYNKYEPAPANARQKTISQIGYSVVSLKSYG